MYPMTFTRPYLAYPLSILAHFDATGRHRPSHWYVAKRVAKYLASTSVTGLVLGGKQPVTLTGFSDSTWADDAESLWYTLGTAGAGGARAGGTSAGGAGGTGARGTGGSSAGGAAQPVQRQPFFWP
ncbi:unnamed protein product [Closterium sp. NIES-54]